MRPSAGAVNEIREREIFRARQLRFEIAGDFFLHSAIACHGSTLRLAGDLEVLV